MMNIIFLKEAQQEFFESVSRYEAEQTGLGSRFKDEVDRSLRWLAQNSEACRLSSAGYRRLNLRIFPYYIPYIIRQSNLWVLAIAHASRKPEYWIERNRDVG
jgi:plasmid stabilization system protein ParE